MLAKKLIAFAAAVPLCVAPIAAQATVSSLQGAAVQRTSSLSGGEAEEFKGNSALLPFLAFLIASGLLILLVSDDDPQSN